MLDNMTKIWSFYSFILWLTFELYFCAFKHPGPGIGNLLP